MNTLKAWEKIKKYPRVKHYVFIPDREDIKLSRTGLQSMLSWSDYFVGVFDGKISLEDFTDEIEFALKQFKEDDAHIKAIEDEFGDGAGVFVRMTDGIPYSVLLDPSYLTQKEKRNISRLFPETKVERVYNFKGDK